MHLILLSGNGLPNKSWIEQVDPVLTPLFESTKIQNYDHWTNGNPVIDLEAELVKLVTMAQPLDSYSIFAKSIGTVLTAKAVYDHKITPAKCIFLGLPISWSRQYHFDLDTWFTNFPIPTLIIQHNHDPYTPASEVSEFIQAKHFLSVKLVTLPGTTHDYLEFDTIKSLISEFL
jgi:pimeloyl-ACP methyl ester carboxylesterase